MNHDAKLDSSQLQILVRGVKKDLRFTVFLIQTQICVWKKLLSFPYAKSAYGKSFCVFRTQILRIEKTFVVSIRKSEHRFQYLKKEIQNL